MHKPYYSKAIKCFENKIISAQGIQPRRPQNIILAFTKSLNKSILFSYEMNAFLTITTLTSFPGCTMANIAGNSNTWRNDQIE